MKRERCIIDPFDKLKIDNSWQAVHLKSTGLVYDERMLKHKHEWFIEEQESPRRIQQAFHRCVEENLVSRCIRVPISLKLQSIPTNKVFKSKECDVIFKLCHITSISNDSLLVSEGVL
ncbi:unnamed protein product [Schistosoma curassoni]|uniref:YqaJ domain-containing protein n=1 Tax=Schistosoma curassoni TaxID=6186 RepID=A0A183KLM9_9TREM|nr:unnamed protein product [Schistosoma curassoni]